MAISDQPVPADTRSAAKPENQPDWQPISWWAKETYDSSLKLARMWAKDGYPEEAEVDYQEALVKANTFDIDGIHKKLAELEKSSPHSDKEWQDLKEERAFLQSAADVPLALRLEIAQFELSHLHPEKAAPLLDQAAKLQPPGGGDLKKLTDEVQHQKDALAKHPDLPRDSADLKRIMDKLWAALDTDKNGYLSAKELEDAVHNPAFSGASALAVSALSQDFKDMSTLNDSHWFKNPGISRKDIDSFDYVRTHKEEVSEEQARIQQIGIVGVFGFSIRSVTKKTVDDMLASKSGKPLEPSARECLKMMSAHWSEISTKGYLDRDKSDALADRLKHQIETVHKVDQLMEANHRELVFDCKNLYGDAAAPGRSVVVDAVRDGGDKDSNFRKALSWLTATKPGEVEKMIKQNSDGTYTVTFPNAKSEPIVVKPPTDGELITRKYGSEYGAWAPIVEKAYDAYVAKHFYRYRVNLFDKPVWQF